MGGGKEERAYHRGEDAVMGGEGRGTRIVKEKGMSDSQIEGDVPCGTAA